MDTLESLRRKMEGAEDLDSVVRTMKAVAASNIGQYESAVNSLKDYYQTVTLGITAYFREEKETLVTSQRKKIGNRVPVSGALIFGSDQGLVGQFNDSLTDFVGHSLNQIPGKMEVWAVGERIQLLLEDAGLNVSKVFSVPGSVNAITMLVGQILIRSQESLEKGEWEEFYIFHNRPGTGPAYMPAIQQLLPLDKKWSQSMDEFQWPGKNIPQVAGARRPALSALIREYLFVSLFQACAESLASENSSRLGAMQRAEKNIEELLEDLKNKFHRLRQSSIDEELFDVLSGFEALKKEKENLKKKES